jgi:hypothetical protein
MLERKAIEERARETVATPNGAEVGGEGGDVKAEGRLMDHAELKRLCEVQMREHLGHTMNKTTGLCYNETCNIARATLALLDERRWRKCEEKMPESRDNVLVCSGISGRNLGWYKSESNQWFDVVGWEIRSVTHWQALPAPPEGT